jgi:hypothetical protein
MEKVSKPKMMNDSMNASENIAGGSWVSRARLHDLRYWHNGVNGREANYGEHLLYNLLDHSISLVPSRL